MEAGAVEEAVGVDFEVLDIDVGEFPRGEHDDDEGEEDLENVEDDAKDGGGFGLGHGRGGCVVCGWEQRFGGVRDVEEVSIHVMVSECI